MAAAGKAHITCLGGETFAADAACAALDALRGARVVAIRFSRIDGIPASALSHHSSLWRLEFIDCAMPPLCDLAGYTQLHGLRELVYRIVDEDEDHVPDAPSYQLQHAQLLSQLEVLDIDGMLTEGADTTLAALPRLRELNLSGSDLRTVPASMASLTRLTRLDLSFTRVTSEWQRLPLQLERLDFRMIGLSVLPPELSRLSRLTEMDLTCNTQLEGGSLQVLGRLGSLLKLRLCVCHLVDAAILDVALPTTLQCLDLAYKRLTAVPAALAPLTGLAGLDFGCNQLVGGWQHLAGMHLLADLSVFSCRLTAIPVALSQLTALTSLRIDRNPIAGGWEHLAGMQQLASLSVDWCRLTAVPQVLSQLTALTRLIMSGNPVSSDWQHLASMQQLETLSLYTCRLTTVPQVFSQLTALTSLDMSSNPIASGWQHLARMQQLASLSVSSCSLSAVPQVLSQLTALTSLDLTFNPIASGWQHPSLLPLHELRTDDPAHCIPPP